MKVKKMTLVWIVLALIVAMIAFFAMDREGFWQRVAGNPDLGEIDFATLGPAPKPNEGLICPPEHCKNRLPDQASKEYTIPAEQLKNELVSALAQLPLTHRVDDETSPLKARYVTFSPLMRYPDTMNIEFIALSDSRSTIAIHGRAQIGQSDLGANLRRIQFWLKNIDQFAAN